MNLYPHTTHVYADGGVIEKNPSEQGGTWAWCHVRGEVESEQAHAKSDWGYVTTELFDAGPVSNNVMELYAVVLALEALPDDWSGIVSSDSAVTIGRLSTWTLPPGVAMPLRGVPAPLQSMVWRQTRRLSWGSIQWRALKGHPTREDLRRGSDWRKRPVSFHNYWCDKMCREATLRYLEDLRRAERARLTQTGLVTAYAVRPSSSTLATQCRALTPRLSAPEARSVGSELVERRRVMSATTGPSASTTTTTRATS
jgi:ribonuclease HI